jgi:hypothetical protein
MLRQGDHPNPFRYERPHTEVHPMRSREQIHPCITPALRKRLALYSSKKGTTKSAVVEAALLQYLDAEVTDRALILRRLDRLTRAGAIHQRNFELLSEAFGVFVQLWFAHTPRLAEDEKAGAEQVARARYTQFLEHVSSEVANGRSMARKIAPDDTSEETDITGGSR